MSVTVTASDVKGKLKIFQDADDSELDKQIILASSQAEKDGLTGDQLDTGTLQFARHLAFVDWAMSYGGVQSASTMGNSQTNLNLLMSNDPYLLDYNRTVDAFGNGANMGAVWTE